MDMSKENKLKRKIKTEKCTHSCITVNIEWCSALFSIIYICVYHMHIGVGYNDINIWKKISYSYSKYNIYIYNVYQFNLAYALVFVCSTHFMMAYMLT
jgi:hypothetical protein